MNDKKLSGGTVHTMPADLGKALAAVPAARTAWESLTPLARNEWICWNTLVKKAETRADHVKRTVQELQEGKRRPCCWVGCLHRTDKPLSKSAQWVISRQSKSSKK